jgi:hypothetical protein
MAGSLNPAMTAALLSVRVEVANFQGLIAAVLPLNLYIGLFHISLLPLLRASPAAKAVRFLRLCMPLFDGFFYCL